ncbi:MAG: mannose-1-phosphate guanylyltransferase [bacterium]
MAGGSGTRFWPKSREKHPKQLLNIHGNGTMIQQTIRRLQPIIPPEKIYLVTTRTQISESIKQLPEIPKENFIVEPYGKNTAPCIGLGSLFMQKHDPEAVTVVLPADHLIEDEQRFIEQLVQAADVAVHTDALVTIGIQPTFPSTGYGYIQHTGEKIESPKGWAYKVKTFAEKPNYETACRFLESGEFLWNSGIFVWKISAIMNELEEHLPELSHGLVTIGKALGTSEQEEITEKVYRQTKSISIDYGVMEYARNVAVVPGDFNWNDLGSWDEVYKIQEKDANGNVAETKHILLDSKNCFVEVKDKIVAAIGVDDLIVVDTDGAILLCPRNRAQDVKEIVETLKRKKMDHLL